MKRSRICSQGSWFLRWKMNVDSEICLREQIQDFRSYHDRLTGANAFSTWRSWAHDGHLRKMYLTQIYSMFVHGRSFTRWARLYDHRVRLRWLSHTSS